MTLIDGLTVGTAGIAGKVIYLILQKAVAAAPQATATSATQATPGLAESAAPRQRTSRCAHGPRGACQHCLPATDEELAAPALLNKAAAFNSRAAARSEATTGAGAREPAELEWLCRHRPDQMCLNCVPLRKGETVELEMLCTHSRDARCINCLPPDTTVDGRKFLTYDEWLERARDKCSHSFGATCVHCAPPVQARYKMRSGCVNHKPWPAAICLECAPVTVELARQPYRHVDKILINCAAELQSIISIVAANARDNYNRAGVLYGRYAADPAFRHGQQVVVDAVYEPPQRCDPATGVVTVLPDPAAAAVSATAAACGLSAVGWVFSRPPARTAAAGAAAAGTAAASLTPHELYAMAAAQLAHSPRADGRPGSQWVTLLIVRDPGDGQYHLQGAMASDQLVAMARDGVLTPPKPGDALFKRAPPSPPPAPPQPDILLKSMARGAHRVESFDADMCLVSLEAAGPKPGSATAAAFPPLFRGNAAFPVENREAMGVRQSAEALRRLWLDARSLPPAQRIASFHALIFIASFLDVATAESAARSVVSGAPLEEGVELLIKSVAGEA